MEITNIANDGFTYEWNEEKNHEYNLKQFFKKNNPADLAKYFLEKKTLRWEGKSYREVLGTSTVLEELVLNYYEELGFSLWKQVILNGGIWDKFDGYFAERAMNRKFRHKEIDIDGQKLMNAIAPMIKTNDIYKRAHTDNMKLNPDFPLIYFKALNDNITKKKAEEIFEDFNKDGMTFLGLEAQYWLVDNNKYIRKVIDELELWHDFPPQELRDLFIF